MSINLDILNNFIEEYKKDYAEYFKDEVYKYETIKIFQDNWNIEETNFVEMLKKSLAKSYNLLTSYNYFAMKMIIEMAEYESEKVREMFRVLYDENKSIKYRYDFFINTSKEIISGHCPSERNPYQDAHSISVYLALRYPEKYYIYKTILNNKVAIELGIDIRNKDKGLQLNNYFSFCDLVKKEILNDKELFEIIEKNGLYKEYCDDYYINEVVFDLLYYIGRKLEKRQKSNFTWVKIYNNIAKEIIKYSPKELAEIMYEMLEKTKLIVEEGKGSNFDYDGKKRIKYEEIDPISFMNRFDMYKFENRINLIKNFEIITGMNIDLPKDFDGIPSVSPFNSCVISFKDSRGKNDINDIKELFEYVVINNNIDREKFIELYDKVISKKYASFNISIGLFKIRPDIFLNLDSTNREYIKEKLEINITTCPGGYEYLDIIEKVRKYIEKNEEIETLLDFSYKAYNIKSDPYSENKSKIWLYSPGEQAFLWNEFYNKNIMAIGWDSIGDVSNLSKKEIEKKLKKSKSDSAGSNNTLAIFEFANIINIGDIVIAKKGISKLIGYGVVTSDYYFDSSREIYKHVRKIDWKKKGEWNFEYENMSGMVRKTLTDLSKYDGYGEKLLDMMKDNTNYYWLNANPKVWSFNELKVGGVINYTSVNENGNKRRIYSNYLEAKKGDKVIAYESTPTKKIVGLCEVEEPLNSKGELNVKKIENLVNPISYSDVIALEEIQNSEIMKNSQGSLFKLTGDEYNALMDLIRDNNPKQEEKHFDIYLKEDFLNEVTMYSDNELDELLNVLENKKNIILQGAPGVGKTFIAKKLSYVLLGEKAHDRIEFVQFHQSYGYEDFVEGYRPKEEGNGFKLKEGIFYKFCKYKAASNPDKKYVFIIDEINRGNISKIFGELLMLIEKDKRGQEVKLSYTGESFKIPENVYIIGMMNTADRSLAIMDYALRRRFSFFDIKPLYESENFKIKIKEKNIEKLEMITDIISEINKAIIRDSSLGEGFEIGHSYFINFDKSETEEVDLFNLKMIVNYEILPLLKEYWFDNIGEYKKWKDKLLGVFND